MFEDQSIADDLLDWIEFLYTRSESNTYIWWAIKEAIITGN